MDKIFTGIDGYSRSFGFTGDDLTRADTLHAMIGSARHVYVLTDSEKFLHPGAVSFLQLDQVYEIVTDEGISPKEKSYTGEPGHSRYNRRQINHLFFKEVSL